MTFFETHLQGCKPSSLCGRCRLYQAIFKVTDMRVREEILRLLPAAVGELEKPQNEVLNDSIDTLDMPTLPKNCLRCEGITTIGALVKKTEQELVYIPRLGRLSLMQIKEALAKKNLYLGM